MSFRPSEPIAALIDGSNTYAAVKTLGFDINYKKLYEWLEHRGNLLRPYYYTAIHTEQSGFANIQTLVDWLSYNGYTLRTKAAKEFMQDGVRKIKGNMDIEFAIDAWRVTKFVKHIYMFTGDGDFEPLVDEIQNNGVKVTVVSTIKTSPPMCADLLRKKADNFVDLYELKPHIYR